GSATGLQLFRAVDYGKLGRGVLNALYVDQYVLATAKHGVLGFGRGLVPLLEDARLPIRVNTLAPSWTESNVLPSLKSLLNAINIEVQPASIVARCAAYLMANTTMNGQVVHVQRGKYAEVDKAVLLPAYRKIKGDDYPSEDEVFERLAAAAA
ncbi:(-)-trans-carveol dehydrogenase, partial [Fusarium beomiforme]